MTPSAIYCFICLSVGPYDQTCTGLLVRDRDLIRLLHLRRDVFFTSAATFFAHALFGDFPLRSGSYDVPTVAVTFSTGNFHYAYRLR